MSLLERSSQGDRVTRAWEGRTVVCVASGPSVTKEQIELIRAARERDAIRVVAVNDMYLVVPFADLCYFADVKWYRWHTTGLAKSWPWISFTAEQVRDAWAAFAGQKVTIKHSDNASGPDIFVLKQLGCEGLSEKPDGIHTGKNSGYQVVNISVLAGGNPTLLVGYDMRYAGNRSHSHNGHPDTMAEAAYSGYAKKFASMQHQLRRLGLSVINCTPGSAIETFPRESLESLLSHSRAAVV